MEFNLLTKKQIKNMKLFKDYGVKAEITDYATNLGGKNENGFGAFYLKAPSINLVGTDNKLCINSDGMYENNSSLTQNEIGLRPIVSYIELFEDGNVDIINGKILSGEYPQTKVDEELEKELNLAIRGRDIFPTGKTYTALSGMYDVPVRMPEYRYKGNKYVNINYYFESGWFKVEPITWLVDMETNMAVSEKILVAGIKYDHNIGLTNTYKKSDIKQYLDNFFARELYISSVSKEEIEKSEENRLKYLKNIKYEITDKILKLELLEVKIKTEIIVHKAPVTEEIQKTLDTIHEQEARLEEQMKQVELEIDDCTNENIVEGKIKVKRIS